MHYLLVLFILQLIFCAFSTMTFGWEASPVTTYSYLSLSALMLLDGWGMASHIWI